MNTAYGRYKSDPKDEEGFKRFCHENAYWLEDYALFAALKDHFNGSAWNSWPEDLRDRKESALKKWHEQMTEQISREKFFQHLFFKQWFSLKVYCNSKNIRLIVDMPIYVSFESADVWANLEIFKLDKEKRPTFVAGVPPDYFSSTGQLWGNPVYNWDILPYSSSSPSFRISPFTDCGWKTCTITGPAISSMVGKRQTFPGSAGLQASGFGSRVHTRPE